MGAANRKATGSGKLGASSSRTSASNYQTPLDEATEAKSSNQAINLPWAIAQLKSFESRSLEIDAREVEIKFGSIL